LRDSVKDGETGLLFPYGDTNKAGEQILEMINNNDKRNTFSSNAIKWASNFNWDQSAQKAIQIIENCIVESEKKNAEK
jgi:glycosyltransferase involved in cell wall biosynthesis